MCGLTGVRLFDDAPVDMEMVLRMREAMFTRGPDSAGLWFDPAGGLALAHRRLSIIDLSDRGSQPMCSPDFRYHVAFNGEIYNYPELRRWCEGQGRVFQSNSDTEILLHLYEMKGRHFVKQLRGMFAFAIWDSIERTLVLGRDPFGIKPLYYAANERGVLFASQVKALLKSGVIETTQSSAGIVSFFLWGYITEPHTLFSSVLALPAGAILTCSPGRPLSIEQYSTPLEVLHGESAGRVSREELRELTLDSVRHHMLSDVPMGLFLSAGIDSGAMLALASECSDASNIQAVTLGFSEYSGSDNDEVPLAILCAARYGCDHHINVIDQERFRVSRQRIIEMMDQPTVDAVNTYFVSAAAAKVGLKVAISGLGGDECFGGYPSFWQVPQSARWMRKVPTAVGKAMRQVLTPLIGGRTSPKYAGLFEYGSTIEGAYLLRRGLFMPWELFTILEPDVVLDGLRRLNVFEMLGGLTAEIRDPHFKVMALEYGVYLRNCLLRDTDWAGMAHGVEIRTPLVDAPLFKAIGTRRGSAGLVLNKNDLATVPTNPLPQQIVRRRRSGFSVPVHQWMGEGSPDRRERGLRGWAKFIGHQFNMDGLK